MSLIPPYLQNFLLYFLYEHLQNHVRLCHNFSFSCQIFKNSRSTVYYIYSYFVLFHYSFSFLHSKISSFIISFLCFQMFLQPFFQDRLARGTSFLCCFNFFFIFDGYFQKVQHSRFTILLVLKKNFATSLWPPQLLMRNCCHSDYFFLLGSAIFLELYQIACLQISGSLNMMLLLV